MLLAYDYYEIAIYLLALEKGKHLSDVFIMLWECVVSMVVIVDGGGWG